ncbi:allophanate hydrolase [Nitrospira sp.]|nr:allophanate hydrolase [Nitrospira sp.]
MSPRTPAVTRMTVVKPGWLTTVQDRGREGYRRYGVSVSGAMDRIAYTLGNRLVGNADGAAALEITVSGPEIIFESQSVFAVTGGDLSPTLDGRPIVLWTGMRAPSGSRLSFGARRTGARCYLAVAGGIDVPPHLGSRSTHIATRTGGLQGRPLTKGVILHTGRCSQREAREGLAIPVRLRPRYSPSPVLRVLPGPQHELFLPDVLVSLVSAPYTLSSQSDRMGYRLVGPKLRHAAARWISDGTVMGALQVPADEQPILLMADCQTIGGYPKPAVVISADLHLAGQLAPGDSVHFVMTTLAEARRVLRAQWAALDEALPAPRSRR